MKIAGRQRKMLAELCDIANKLGSPLDYTATSYIKLREYQIAYMDFHHALYGILCDEAENDMRDSDLESSKKAIAKLTELTKKQFGDRISSV